MSRTLFLALAACLLASFVVADDACTLDGSWSAKYTFISSGLNTTQDISLCIDGDDATYTTDTTIDLEEAGNSCHVSGTSSGTGTYTHSTGVVTWTATDCEVSSSDCDGVTAGAATCNPSETSTITWATDCNSFTMMVNGAHATFERSSSAWDWILVAVGIIVICSFCCCIILVPVIIVTVIIIATVIAMKKKSSGDADIYDEIDDA